MRKIMRYMIYQDRKKERVRKIERERVRKIERERERVRKIYI
jgi:hypothetical protein